MRFGVVGLFVVGLIPRVCGFVPLPTYGSRILQVKVHGTNSAATLLRSQTTDSVVDELMRVISSKSSPTATGMESEAIPSSKDQRIAQLMKELLVASNASNSTIDQSSEFDSLIGFYNVSHTIKARETDNPVGGRWTRTDGLAQKLLRTRRTCQHILPVNTTGEVQDSRDVVAEVVNFIILEAWLFRWLTIYVILRGDAVPLAKAPVPTSSVIKRRSVPRLIPHLSHRCVRVFFDSPRIILAPMSRFPIPVQVGPTSSVVLDTPYVDPQIRVGIGGTSGTKFLFVRCLPNDDEAKQFLPFIQRQTIIRKRNMAIALLSLAVGGVSSILSQRAMVMKLIGTMITATSLLVFGLVVTSSGGIERDGDTFQPGK